MSENRKVQITLRAPFKVTSMLHGQVTLEVEVPKGEALELYALFEGTLNESGSSFQPPTITFDVE